MIGIAAATGIDIGTLYWPTVLRADGITRTRRQKPAPVVAEALNGTIYHGRNMDYDFTDALRNLTVVIDYQQGGKTLYTGTTFVGMVGMLSAQRPYGCLTVGVLSTDSPVLFCWWNHFWTGSRHQRGPGLGGGPVVPERIGRAMVPGGDQLRPLDHSPPMMTGKTGHQGLLERHRQGKHQCTGAVQCALHPSVMNNGTTYTVTMSAAIPELFFTWVRYP
eukprot:Em0011g125a